MKLKRFGKNQRELKKLLKNENTKVINEYGIDITENFKRNFIGFYYNFNSTKEGLELVDLLGEKILIKTEEPIEII